jgi:O-antigen/teichoic acid export membrane protein
MVPLAFFNVSATILRGKQRTASYASLNLALIILQLTALFLLRLQGGGIIVLAILLLSVQAIGVILAGHLCQFQILFSSQPFHELVRQLFYLIRICAPIAVLGLLCILYQRLSLIIILSISGTTSTEDYSAAAIIVEAAKIGHVAIFTALHPLMTQVNATDKLNWVSTFRFPVLLLLGGAITASFILFWLAKPFISILFGTGYNFSSSPLQVLSWFFVPYTINSFLSLVFLAENKVLIIMLSLMTWIITLIILTI